MQRSLVASIAGAYRAPRAAMADLSGTGPDEKRSLVHLMLACFLLMVASLPGAVRISWRIEADDPLSGAIAAHVFGYLFLAPLLFFGLSAAIHLVARGFGGAAGYAGARAAVFWTLLLGAPLALAVSLSGVAEEAVSGSGLLPLTGLLSYAVFGFWLWLLAAALAEAEAFASTGRVLAALALVFGGLAMISAGLPDAPPA